MSVERRANQVDSEPDSSKNSNLSFFAWSMLAVAVIAVVLVSMATIFNSRHNNPLGPFPRTVHVELPEGYQTHITPLDSEDWCVAGGPGRLLLLRHEDGFVMARYDTDDDIGHRSNCASGAVFVESLADWNWHLTSIEYHQKRHAEDQRRREAERNLMR